MKTTEELAKYGTTGVNNNNKCECNYGMCPHKSLHHGGKIVDVAVGDLQICYNCFKQYVRDGLIQQQ